MSVDTHEPDTIADIDEALHRLAEGLKAGGHNHADIDTIHAFADQLLDKRLELRRPPEPQ